MLCYGVGDKKWRITLLFPLFIIIVPGEPSPKTKVILRFDKQRESIILPKLAPLSFYHFKCFFFIDSAVQKRSNVYLMMIYNSGTDNIYQIKLSFFNIIFFFNNLFQIFVGRKIIS